MCTMSKFCQVIEKFVKDYVLPKIIIQNKQITNKNYMCSVVAHFARTPIW